jgi:hypothetical protein
VRLITPHAEWFLNGRKTALLLTALSADRYREVPGGPWRLRDDGFAHGRPVSAVQHAFRGYVSQEGGLIQLRSLVTREVIPIQVTGICMVECDDLYDQAIHGLGYATRDVFQQDGGWFMADQLGWLLSATLASRVSTLH